MSYAFLTLPHPRGPYLFFQKLKLRYGQVLLELSPVKLKGKVSTSSKSHFLTCTDYTLRLFQGSDREIQTKCDLVNGWPKRNLNIQNKKVKKIEHTANIESHNVCG